MNWNNNDTKYIIKKVIIYLLISVIIFFIGSRYAKAGTISSATPSYSTGINGNDRIHYMGNPDWLSSREFVGLGSGYIIGNYFINASRPNYGLKQLTLQTKTNSGTVYTTNCEIGNMSGFYDSDVQWSSYQFKCPVAFGSDAGLYSITARFIANNHDGWISNNLTFVGDNSDANLIMNGQQQAISSQITNDNANAQAIQNAINQSTSNTINAITNQNTIINNNTQAINDLTDVINSQYNSNTGTGYLSAFDNLFTQQDENVIRQFVMIPFNLYILLYNSITNGSCQSISLGSLYGVNLELPCINYRDIIGVPLYTTIDTIFGACLLFGIVRMIKKFFNSLFSVSSKATDENGIEVFR